MTALAARYGFLFCWVTFVMLVPLGAQAHPELDAAELDAREARFAEALSHLDAALSGDDLTREELISALRSRVLMHFAERHDKALERDARSLLAVDSWASLGDGAPPELRARFEKLRAEVEPLSANVEVTEVPGGVRISLEAAGMPASGFRIEIGMRSGDNPWQRSSDGELRYPASRGAEVELYAMVVGPGGAPVAGRGTPSEPEKLRVSVAPSVPDADRSLTMGPRTTDDTPRTRRWWWIGASAVVAVAAGVAVAVLSTRDDASKDSDVQSPTVTYP